MNVCDLIEMGPSVIWRVYLFLRISMNPDWLILYVKVQSDFQKIWCKFHPCECSKVKKK